MVDVIMVLIGYSVGGMVIMCIDIIICKWEDLKGCIVCVFVGLFYVGIFSVCYVVIEKVMLVLVDLLLVVCIG